MKSFFGKIFASCLGTLLFFLLLITGFMLIGVMSDNTPSISSNSVLHIVLNGPIKERVEKDKNLKVLFYDKATTDLSRIVKAINTAKTDKKIKGIYLSPILPIMGYTSADIIRKALKDFKTSGKFVYSYSSLYTPLSYYISSIADSVFLNPGGIIEKKGFARASAFLKEFSDNIGVKYNIFYAGKFKSATEPLRLNKMSEENRLQLREFYNGIYKQTRDTLLVSRPQINKDSLESFVNNFKGLFADNAVKYKLVDSLLYDIDFVDLLKKKLNVKKNKRLKMVNVSKYYRTIAKINGKKSKNKIAVIYMDGNIVDSGKEPGTISPEKYAKTFDDIIRKDKIKGVVVRVNSPGGSGSASDDILRSLDRIREAGKPVVISMGDYAASGGYFISCHADTIVASANTLTGSIGVFAVFPELKKLWEEKLKIHYDSVKTHKMGLSFSSAMGMDDNGKALIQSYIDKFYEDFLNTVAKGRNMTRDQVHEIAQGRIWLGSKAKELGLVDVLGDLEDAKKICAGMANLDDYSFSFYPKVKRNFVQEMMEQIINETDVDAKIENSKYIREFKPLVDIINDKSMIAQPQARMPYDIEFR